MGIAHLEILGYWMANVNEDPGIVFGDLVQQYRSRSLHKCDRSMLRYWEFHIFEDGAHKVTPGCGLEPRFAHDLVAEVGEASIGDDNEVGEELDALGFLAFCEFPVGVDADDVLWVMWVLDELRHGRFYHLNTLRLQSGFPEFHDELSMMEASPFVSAGIWNVHLLAILENAVAVDGDRVDALQRPLQAEFLQRVDTAWLQQFSDDAVGLGERAFQESYPEGLAVAGEERERVRKG